MNSTIDEPAKSCKPEGFSDVLLAVFRASADDASDTELKAMILAAYERGDIWPDEALRLIQAFGLQRAAVPELRR